MWRRSRCSSHQLCASSYGWWGRPVPTLTWRSPQCFRCAVQSGGGGCTCLEERLILTNGVLCRQEERGEGGFLDKRAAQHNEDTSAFAASAAAWDDYCVALVSDMSEPTERQG